MLGVEKTQSCKCFILEKKRVGTLKRLENSQFGFIRLDDSQVSTQLSVPAHSQDSLDDGNIWIYKENKEFLRMCVFLSMINFQVWKSVFFVGTFSVVVVLLSSVKLQISVQPKRPSCLFLFGSPTHSAPSAQTPAGHHSTDGHSACNTSQKDTNKVFF